MLTLRKWRFSALSTKPVAKITVTLPTAQHLALTLRDHVLIVSLNRPAKKNAMSFALLRELIVVASYVKQQPVIRAVVLQGEGSAFSTGIDLTDLNNPKHSALAAWELLKPAPSLFQEAFIIWQSVPVPVLAVLHGYCLGAGMQLALAADIRICTTDCQLAIMESRWGLVPDMGLSQTLRGLVGLDTAKELTFSARMFTGQQAQQYGLVTHVAQSLDEAKQHAADLTAEFLTRSPDALAAAKAVLNALHTEPPVASLRLEKRWQLKLLRGKNSRIARAKAKQPDLEFLPRQFD